MGQPVLQPESKIKLPNVGEAINLGYSMHVADDVDLKGTLTQEVARRRVGLFMEIETTPGSPERAYYECVSDIAISLGRSITRAKEQYRKDELAALEKQIARREQVRDARKSSDGLNLVFRLLKPILLLLAGILIAQLIGLFTPLGVLVKTKGLANSQPIVVIVINILASAFMGIGSMVVGRSISSYMTDFKRSRIDQEYNAERSLAFFTYEESKRAHFRFFHSQLCQAWKTYTDEDYVPTISYEAVAEGDLLARKKIQEKMDRASMGDVLTIMRFLRRFGFRLRKRNGGEEAAA